MVRVSFVHLTHKHVEVVVVLAELIVGKLMEKHLTNG